MPKVIAITGPQGSGKSTLASAIIAEFESSNGKRTGAGRPLKGNAAIFKFADPLYRLQKVIYDYVTPYCGLPALKVGEKDRRLLQLLGCEWAQERFGSNVWADVWKRRVSDCVLDLIVTDDMRFPRELNVAKEVGATTIRLTCPEDVRASRIGSNFGGTSHPSETALSGVSDACFDFVFATEDMGTDAIVAALKKAGTFDEI